MPTPPHLTATQELVLALLSAGNRITDAAQSAGVHRNTVGNWLRSSQLFRDGLTSAQYSHTLFARERAEELVDDAWSEINAVLRDPKASPSVRLKAAMFIIQYATAPLPALPAGLPEMMPGYDLNPPKTHNDAQPEPEKPQSPAPAPEPIPENPPAGAQSCTTKIGRNARCPCGSGLKIQALPPRKAAHTAHFRTSRLTNLQGKCTSHLDRRPLDIVRALAVPVLHLRRVSKKGAVQKQNATQCNTMLHQAILFPVFVALGACTPALRPHLPAIFMQVKTKPRNWVRFVNSQISPTPARPRAPTAALRQPAAIRRRRSNQPPAKIELPMPERLKSLYLHLGRVEKVFLLLLLLTWVLSYAAPSSAILLLAIFAVWILGFAVAIRLARTGIRKLIWRLRNRLIVAYLFIAMVPILLILVLVAFSTYGLTGQIALFLVNSELDRRTAVLKEAAELIARSSADMRLENLQRAMGFTRSLFPSVEILVHDNGEYRYPPASAISLPPEGWLDANGIILRDRQLYSWAYLNNQAIRIVIMAPLSKEFLSDLLPGIGAVDFQNFVDSAAGAKTGFEGPTSPSLASRIPAANNFMDIRVNGAAPEPVMFWKSPNNKESRGVLLIHTRISAVLGAIFGNNIFLGDMRYGQVIWVMFLVTVGLFLIVELVSLVIGVSITRTITSAVHELYQGTRRVKEGDFSHKIPVRGDDQLAELGASFNTMTDNLERLIVVAKEKERLQSELEIAREVQGQLFPKEFPGVQSLTLTGVCNPARVVSGDYYDFMCLADTTLAMAIGDVAGKGISAALLMASIQSTMRMQLTGGFSTAGNGMPQRLSTAAMVARLNKQLYANTSPEKYATFYFALYDDKSHTLTYTNAGHLPPILLHEGAPQLLQVTGTVVGAFPFSRYEEKQVQLASGDVVVAYTDGIVEPENEYGEMFGEQRLTDLLVKNADRDSHEIIGRVMEAVQQWTGATAELQDDMTILVARRP